MPLGCIFRDSTVSCGAINSNLLGGMRAARGVRQTTPAIGCLKEHP